MPITAPDITTTPISYTTVSLRFIDSTGDVRTVSSRFLGAVTPAQVQAYAEAQGAASNANLFSISIQQEWAGTEQKALATEAVYNSVYDNVVLLYGGDLSHSERTFIPAPVEAIMGNTDQPILTNPLLVAVRDTFNTLLDVGTENFTAKSARFTERREKNESVKY